MGRQKEFDTNVAIDRAMELFWLKGYERTSLSDLLDHIEIGRASFYNAFGDKHEIFMMALRQFFVRTDEEIIIKTLEKEESRLEAIKQVFQVVTDALSGDALQRGCLIVNAAIEVAPSDEEVAVFVREYSHRCESAFYDALRRAQQYDEIPQNLDLRATARFLFSTLHGMRVTARMTRERRIFEDIASTALSALN